MASNTSTLNKIKSMRNYGFYITGNTTDPLYTEGWMSSTPNITILGATVYIDYSHTFDISDLVYLKSMFGTTGITCSFSNTEYFDDLKNTKTSVGGIIEVNSTLNDNRIIIGKILSGFTYSNNYNYYSKENFLKTPEISRSSTSSYTGYFLVNSMPHSSLESFKSLGILGNDFGYEEYIEISGSTAENKGRLQVKSVCTLKDGREILYFLSGATTQDFTKISTFVDLYLRGNTEKLNSPRLSNLNGIFLTRKTTDNTVVDCFENQSQDQSIMRQEALALNDFTLYGNFINCKSCFDLLYGENGTVLLSQIGHAFNNLMFLRIINGTAVVSEPAIDVRLSTINTFISIPSSVENIIKIDLSHPSLLKYDLSFYTESTRKVLISSNQFEKYGEIGYNNSFAIIKNYGQNRTLYGVLQGPSTLYFNINV